MRNLNDYVKALMFGVLVIIAAAAGTAQSDTGYTAERTVRQWTDGATASCSVVVIAPGVALTAAHCADLAVVGATIDGLKVTAVKVASDGRDVAALRVPGLACPCAKPASTPAEIGDIVYAIGYPYGLPTRVVTHGEAQGLYVLPQDGKEYMVATVAVRPGSSGGGVFNSDGLLLGIVSRGDEAGVLLLYVEVI